MEAAVTAVYGDGLELLGEFGPDMRIALESAMPILVESLAAEAFRDKKIQGLQRVLVGNWLRNRATK